ncbi:OPCML [Mytilus coruscus]|uniref:OPCML n=1 Tax=Mytilus coruscus TaxID=42192 RepID=A0A6J8BV32_MYTCO|nr:OPCML [Mytilus coruscus]
MFVDELIMLEIVVNNDAGDFDLQIENVSLFDEGLYECDVEPEDKNETIAKSRYLLQIKALPTEMVLVNATWDDTITGIENESLVIECRVKSGKPPENLTLKINEVTVNTGGHGSIAYDLIPDRTNHNNQLLCEAESPLTPVPLSKTVKIDIKYMPKVMINHDEEVAVLEGANKTLCCDIDSNANISFIFWSKEGKGITSNINSSCLFFKYLDRQDRGNYTCFAGNEIGNGSFETSLTVYYHSSVHLEYTNFPIKERTRAVQCKGDGVPNNITYFRLEHLSDFNEHIRYLDVSSDGIAKLPSTIESKRYQDTGFYLYNASNGVSDEKGNMFQYDQAYLVSAAANKKIQYGEIGKPIDIIVKVYSTSEIKCLHLNAIGSLNIKDILKKSVPMRMHFHGVSIKANGIEVTFRLVKLQSFQRLNITVCNDFAIKSFILEVIKREHNNQMISTDSRLVVENRNISMVSGEQHLESNNDSNTSEHTIATSDDEINASEHLDDGYERPYTTLVAHIYAEEEHGYSSTKTSSINYNSTTLQNATCRPCFAFTEKDKQKTFIFTDDGQENTK